MKTTTAMPRKKKKRDAKAPVAWKAGFKLTLTAAVALALNGAGLLAIGEALAYYFDGEASPGNTFVAGEVDFALDASEFDPATTAISLSPGEITRKNIDVDPQDSNPFQYAVSTENASGDIDFCEALQAEAELEGVGAYDGDLASMLTSATTTLDSWEFTIGMGEANFQNKICDFDFQYFGSQTRHDYDLGGGFDDTETQENTIASWGFRINKVYYDVAPDRGEEGANEWVEIYNQTNVPLDINGWELCDNQSCDTLGASEDIPAMGYGFITASSTTASNVLPSFWYLPEDVVEIAIPDLKIGNGLHNDADMLVLKRPDGVIADQMNWGDDPDETWPNWNEDVWEPGSVDVAEGNALARVSSGYDTNQPSDFTELVPPSVDLVYPDEGGTYVWYWGFSYTIEWDAVNNNGNDEDLDMSIFFIRDINGDVEISDGDIMFTIVETTENDGEYLWTVPSGFLGYIWIYVVATGPENPMWNSGTISGDIYDPFPLLIRPLDLGDLEEEEFVLPVAQEEETPAAEETVEEEPAEEDSQETPASTGGAGGDAEETSEAEEPAAEEPAGETSSGEVSEDIIGEEETAEEAVAEEEAGAGAEEGSAEEALETPTEPVVEEEPASDVSEEAPDVAETREDGDESVDTSDEPAVVEEEPEGILVVEEEPPSENIGETGAESSE